MMYNQPVLCSLMQMHNNIITHAIQIIFVNIRYGSPRPKAAVMELSRDGGLTFEPIQYYADDCMFYFGLPDNGQIVNADDANCVTSSSV